MAGEEANHRARGLRQRIDGAAEERLAAVDAADVVAAGRGGFVLDQIGGGHGLVAAADVEDHAFGACEVVLADQLLGAGAVAVGIDELDRHARRGGGVFLQQGFRGAEGLAGRPEQRQDADVAGAGFQQAAAGVGELREARGAPVKARVVAQGEIVDHAEDRAGQEDHEQQVGAQEHPLEPAGERRGWGAGVHGCVSAGGAPPGCGWR